MDNAREEGTSPDAATLDSRTLELLSHSLQDIRTTISQLQTPGISPLAALDANAVDALKNLYYVINTEDPMNAMPARRYVLEQRIVRSALLPLVAAVHSDPSSETNQKRWSVPMYQSLRLLSVLSLPISAENVTVRLGSSLDSSLLKLRADLAESRFAVQGFVALLQYYIERKAEKHSELSTAEESKLEDARIDNILRFFRNILSPPRRGVGEEIFARDRGVHLALVGALVQADFYSTLAVIFSSREDAHSQYTDIVFLVADVYAHTYRHTTPRQMYHSYKQHQQGKGSCLPNASTDNSDEGKGGRTSVFASMGKSSDVDLAVSKEVVKPDLKRAKSTRIRAALSRERSVIGGARAVTTSARWMSRHSGGFLACRKPNGRNGVEQSADKPAEDIISSDTFKNGANPRNVSTKRVVSARNMIQSKLSLNPLHDFQEDVKISSDILCLLAAKGRSIGMKRHVARSKLSETMRRDLQNDGLRGIVVLTTELVDVSFQHFVKELRSRIEETKSRSLGDENEVLSKAQRAYLAIVGSVVGFQRERYGKVYKNSPYPERSLSAQVHENCMKSILASDFKIAKGEWRSVEAGLELESFQLVFRTLVDSCSAIKTSGKDENKIRMVEMSTFAILEMMKMLQGMAANLSDDGDEQDIRDGDQVLEDIRNQKSTLTPREIALNTLEQLFEQHEFLNAPADLAKDYSVKLYSFEHLTNIVEISHAFTTILLDEKELAHLQVIKKKAKTKGSKRTKRDKVIDEKEKSSMEGPGSSKEHSSPPLAEASKDTPKSAGSSAAPNETLRRGTLEGPVETGDERHGEREAPDLESSVNPNHREVEEPKSESIRGTVEGESASREKPERDSAEEEKDVDVVEHLKATDEEDLSDEDEAFEPELREVESIGIIRRYAHVKAIETLLMPLRAAICNASGLTGYSYSIPDGGAPLLANVVVAKAAHALSAIWKVAKLREKGALCGQFLTFGTMQLMSTVLEAVKRDVVLEHSVLARFSVLSRDVARTFFSWLTLSPGLTLDMFFSMDKGSCQTYATSIGRKAVLEQQQKEAHSGNESDISALAIEPRRGSMDFERIEERPSTRNARKKRSSRRSQEKMAEIRRSERVKIEEDEDVDIDLLDIGGGMESPADENDEGRTAAPNGEASEEAQHSPVPKAFCRLSKSKRKRATTFPSSSDDDAPDERLRKKRTRKESVKVGMLKKVENADRIDRLLESSDEYAEVDTPVGSESEKPDEVLAVAKPVAGLPDGKLQAPEDNVEDHSVSEDGKGKERQDSKRRRLVLADSDDD